MRAKTFCSGSRGGFQAPVRAILAALTLLAGSSLAVSTSSASQVLYLNGDGVPVASLSAEAPATASLPNFDPGRDSAPGLVLERGGIGALEGDPFKHQQWVGPADGMVLDGAFDFLFWAAMKEFDPGERGVVEAFLLDCDPAGANCSPIAQGRKDIFGWGGGWGSWGEYSIEFGDVVYTVPPGRALSLKVVVGVDAEDDMWFAYASTEFPSRITDTAASDIVIDGEFADWLDEDGIQVDIFDEGGVDDWSSPSRLDITWFAVSSNLVDTFHILVGSDDVPAQGWTAATLADIDLDNNADYALVVNLDDLGASVELYTCDDTLPDGCGGAVLERSYPPSYYGIGTAPGPWSEDTLLEIALPFTDLDGDAIVLTGLVTYAAATLLTSPKDAIFGVSGQTYTDRIIYDATTGEATVVSELGPTYLVRRHTDPSAVRSATPVASIIQAPFDDLPGTLEDGEVYYYVIERQWGIPVTVSAHPNPRHRLGPPELPPRRGAARLRRRRLGLRSRGPVAVHGHAQRARRARRRHLVRDRHRDTPRP
jgi:hypothetical protein